MSIVSLLFNLSRTKDIYILKVAEFFWLGVYIYIYKIFDIYEIWQRGSELLQTAVYLNISPIIYDQSIVMCVTF